MIIFVFFSISPKGCKDYRQAVERSVTPVIDKPNK